MPDNDNDQGDRSGQGYLLPSASTSHTVILRQSRSTYLVPPQGTVKKYSYRYLYSLVRTDQLDS